MQANLQQMDVAKINNILDRQRLQLKQLRIFSEDEEDVAEQPLKMVQQHNKQLDKMVREEREKSSQKKREFMNMKEEDDKPGFIRKSRVVQKIPETKKKIEQKLQPDPSLFRTPKRQSHVHFSDQPSKELTRQMQPKSQVVTPQLVYSQPALSSVASTIRPSPLKAKPLSKLDPKTVKQYLSSKMGKINGTTAPAKIYGLLNPLYQQNRISLPLPLIKQYNNCVYFGEAVSKDSNYQGFMIFYEVSKVYYGGLNQQRKDGDGVEIDFSNDVIFVGEWELGRKVGRFRVIRSKEDYSGDIKNNLYHGEGVLTTATSIYRGTFKKGQRNGEGEQYFPDSNLTLTGTFINNKFSNHLEDLQKSRLQSKNSKMLTSKRESSLHPSSKLNPEASDSAMDVGSQVYRNYREFNYELDESMVVRRNASFRVKEVKQMQKTSRRERKNSFSEEKPLEKSKIMYV